MSVNEVQTLKAVLASDHHSRSAYTGKISQTENVTVFAEDGTPIEASVTFHLSWESIDQLLALARARAGI